MPKYWKIPYKATATPEAVAARSKICNPYSKRDVAIRYASTITAHCDMKPNLRQLPPFHDNAAWLEKNVESRSERSCAPARRQNQRPSGSIHTRGTPEEAESRSNSTSPNAAP